MSLLRFIRKLLFNCYFQECLLTDLIVRCFRKKNKHTKNKETIKSGLGLAVRCFRKSLFLRLNVLIGLAVRCFRKSLFLRVNLVTGLAVRCFRM